MTGGEGRDDAAAAADDAGPVGGPMRFTVMDRRGDRVHLVSEDDEAMYGHPSVCEEVWQEALREVPTNWEIVDLSPLARTERRAVSDTVDLDEFAARKYELFLAFLGAGFERCEALTLVIETLGDDTS